MSFVASEWEKGGSQPKPSDGGESGSGQTAPSQGSDNWLSGLVSEEAEPAIDRDAGEGWLSGLVSEEAEPAVDRDAGDSWLSGLVKSDDQKVESKPKPVVQSPAPSGSSEPKAEVSAPTKIPDPKRVVEPPSPKQVSEMKPLVKPLAPTKSSKAKSPDSPGLDKEALKSAPKPTPMPGRPTAESRPVPKPVTPPEKPQPIPKPVTPAEKPQPSPALKSLSSGIPRELVSPLVSTSPPEPGPRTTNKLKERPLVPRVTPVDRKEKKPSQPIFKPGVSSRQLVTFYRSLSVMLSSGVPLFACFEFMARDGESEPICQACRRIGQRLVEGYPLHTAVAPEQPYFDQKAIKLIEVGYKSGALNKILARLAHDAEESWKLESQIKSGLIYPLGIAAVATVGVIFLPPLVLNDLLEQIVQLTAEPPPITQAIMSFSAFIGSPWVIATTVALIVGFGLFTRTELWQKVKNSMEVYLWELPAVGSLWCNVVSVRFLSVFALTYDCGLPATQCLILSSSATGSRYADQRGEYMKDILVAGGTLRETFDAGGFLSPLALEAVEAGQQTGKVADLLTRCGEILKAELHSRIEAVAKLVEPAVLMILGTFVGVFALGCLLPIIKLVETL